MKILCSLAGILLSLTLSQQVYSQQSSVGTNLQVITLEGSGYDRGFKHGSTLKESIAELYKKWKKSVASETSRDADSVIADFLMTTNYEEAIKKWTPELWEEIKGIADGSGQDFQDVFAFQLIDEYWGYLDRLEHGSVNKDHCSAIGIEGNERHATVVAQNIDIDTYMQGHQVLFHIPQTSNEPEQFIISSAGFIGFVGVNKERVGVVINALTDLNTNINGLPVTFVTRGILKRNPQNALQFVQDVEHATGQNYIIGTPSEVVNFEASANKVVKFKPTEVSNVVFHTNHSIANHDVKPWMEEYHRRILADTGAKTNSQMRYSSLKRQLTAPQKDDNFEYLKNIFRSKDDPRYPICVTYNKNSIAFTFSSVIFVLEEQPYLEVTNGSPDVSPFKRFYF